MRDSTNSIKLVGFNLVNFVDLMQFFHKMTLKPYYFRQIDIKNVFLFQGFSVLGGYSPPSHPLKMCSFPPTSKNHALVMVIWILVDVQYLQNVVSSFEKRWNGQNHITHPKIPTI